MLSSEEKLSRCRAWLSLAAFMPLLGCMIEAVALRISDLQQEGWIVESFMSGTEMMTALLASVTCAAQGVLFWFLVRHIERGFRWPAVVCGGLMIGVQAAWFMLWHRFGILPRLWHPAVLWLPQAGLCLLPPLYAARLSRSPSRTLSRVALVLFLVYAYLLEITVMTEAFRTLAGLDRTRRIIHGFSYVLTAGLLGAGFGTGFLPSDRQEA